MKAFYKKAMETAKPEELDFKPPLDSGLRPITKVLRTPDECFAGLPDFPFKPCYFQSKSHASIRIHYLDEGPRDAKETILLMHGEPTWCFLYRHMIPPLAAAGLRVVVPDLVGFGKSDKPAERSDYTYERHVDWMSELAANLELSNITLFGQDWGGLIGLRVVSRFPERFLRIVLANTGLPTGQGKPSPAFRVWAGVVSQQIPTWGPLVNNGTVRNLTPAEEAAYDAPFPSEDLKAGSREFPRIVPQFPEHCSVEENKGAWRRVFDRWDKPLLTLFGDSDNVTKGGEGLWKKRVPGASGQPHRIVEAAGHFIQEDQPAELVDHIVNFIRSNPVPLAHCFATAKL